MNDESASPACFVICFWVTLGMICFTFKTYVMKLSLLKHGNDFESKFADLEAFS